MSRPPFFSAFHDGPSLLPSQTGGNRFGPQRHHPRSAEGGTIIARYFIESPHTSEECLDTLDGILAQGSDLLAKYDWGCGVGDHTGYAIVEAASEAAAREAIPSFLRAGARVGSVGKLTPAQVQALHKGI